MNTDKAWEAWAKIDPYYAVLTDERFRAGNDPGEFFDSGEKHIDQAFRTITSIAPAFAPQAAIDFGCGVGRLLIPLSRRASMSQKRC
jgi:hypothetical protein